MIPFNFEYPEPEYLPDNAVMYCDNGSFSTDELNMLIMTRRSVTKRAILPGMASIGTTKLIQDTQTNSPDGMWL